MSKLPQLIKSVEDWAVHKKILYAHNAPQQMNKVAEEVAELKHEVLEHIVAGKDNVQPLKSELGDVFVTIIILSAQLGLDIEDCLDVAYNKIKDRKGKTIDGVFVKESSL